MPAFVPAIVTAVIDVNTCTGNEIPDGNNVEREADLQQQAAQPILANIDDGHLDANVPNVQHVQPVTLAVFHSEIRATGWGQRVLISKLKTMFMTPLEASRAVFKASKLASEELRDLENEFQSQGLRLGINAGVALHFVIL